MATAAISLIMEINTVDSINMASQKALVSISGSTAQAILDNSKMDLNMGRANGVVNSLQKETTMKAVTLKIRNMVLGISSGNLGTRMLAITLEIGGVGME
jgi:hypothetical protein